MKKKLLMSLVCLLIWVGISPIQAESTEYIVLDIITNAEIAIEDDYSSAKTIYDRQKENYEELAIMQNGKIIIVEYGVVSFPIGDGSCTVNYEFTNAVTEEGGYVNGCYGRDGLYLDTNSSGTRIQFMISGAIGWGPIDTVEIIPLSQVGQLTSYVVIEGELFHQIKSDLTSERYATLISLGVAPDYLREGEVYYSYDGHYFYQDVVIMSDDVRASTQANAINIDQPFYNYYQYVTHRTTTNIPVSDVERYLYDELLIGASITKYNDQDYDSVHDVLSQSQYLGFEDAFYEYQQVFGSNAMMMLALSMNESAFGRSSLAYTRNNLFGHAAYDSDVEKNASRYFSVANSIYSHAKNYVSTSYLNPNKFQYHGGFFGDKASGMNVSYASDPYWGEKAAQFYAQLDEQFGYLDLNSVTLGISQRPVSVLVFDEIGNVLYSTGINPNLSFVILGETETHYKIQIDPALVSFSNITGSYDFELNVGYVQKRDIDLVLNPEMMNEKNYIEVTFDANGGLFYSQEDTMHYQIVQGQEATCEPPIKEGSVFVGWDKDLSNVSESTTFVAQYKEVSSIEMNSLPPIILEYNDRIDLTGGSIKVVYVDNSEEIIELTSSMVSGYDIKLDGMQEVIVTYGGVSTSYPLEVLLELDTIRNEIAAKTQQVVTSMGNLTEFSETQLSELQQLQNQMHTYMTPRMTFDLIRQLDLVYYAALHDNLYSIIAENTVNLSISGLYYNVVSVTAFEPELIRDTMRFTHQHGTLPEIAQFMEDIAVANGYIYHSSFELTGEMNHEPITLSDGVLVSMDIPYDIDYNQIITVLQHVDGEVVKLATVQTMNRLIFKTQSFSQYSIVVRDSTNEYLTEDIEETISYATNDFDIDVAIDIGIKVVFALIGVIFLLVVIKLIKNKRRRQKIGK